MLVNTSTNNSKTLVPFWYGDLDFRSGENLNITVAIEVLAINLLYAELQMRAGELQRNDYWTTFSDKIDKVKRMVPYLLHYSSSLGQCDVPLKYKKLVSNLQVRTLWLVSIFYVFWSKCSLKMKDRKEAEKLALEYIDNAINSIQRLYQEDSPSVSTPQLISPGRIGNYWKLISVDNLQLYRDELEASTVLSRCRQNFFNHLADWKKSGCVSTSDLTTEQLSVMKSIGIELFKRYCLGSKKMDVGENTDELIDDFIVNNNSNLHRVLENTEVGLEHVWPDAWTLIPTNKDPIVFDDLTNSSYITTMSLSLLYGEESQLHLASFLGSLIVAIMKYHAKVLNEATMNEMKIKDQEEVDDESVDDFSVEQDNDNFIQQIEKIGTLSSLAHLLLSKLWRMIQDAVQKDSVQQILEALNVTIVTQCLIQLSTGHSDDLFNSPIHHKILTSVVADVNLLKSTLDFAAYIKPFLSDQEHEFDSCIFVELCKTLVSEKNVISALMTKPKRSSDRFELERRGFHRSKYVALIATELAGLLLSHPNIYDKASIKESFLIENLMKVNDNTQEGRSLSLCPLLKLLQSMKWFWTIASKKKSKISDQLRVPIAVVIITLLGSTGHASSAHIITTFADENKENVSVGVLSDYFESDDSVKGLYDEEVKDGDGVGISFSRRSLLHALCRCVQCIGLLFSACDDADISNPMRLHFSNSFEGNFFPLAVVR